MNLLEFYFSDNVKNIKYDEDGNAYYYLRPDDDVPYWLEKYLGYSDSDVLFISKELLRYNIIISKDYDSNTRRPYFRLRGRPVTEEQAFEIIRRIDRFFESNDLIQDFVDTCNFPNWLVNANHYPRGCGWVHPDGLIGMNGITGKYPNVTEFVDEWLSKLNAFPYLDLVIAVTDWDEIPSDLWGVSRNKRRDFELPEYDKDFYKAIETGIWVHDKTIQILTPNEAVEKYKEYDALYGKDRDRFRSMYYEENNIYEIDDAYLKRCIEANGFKFEDVLEKVPKYELEGIVDLK